MATRGLSLVVASVLTVSLAAQARVPRGAVIFVEPTPFGTALQGAIIKKKVPVLVTTDRAQATHFLTSTSEAKVEKTGERVAKIVMFGAWAGNGKTFDASISVTDTKGMVVFAYNTKKGNFQSAADGVAKHLKEHIDGK